MLETCRWQLGFLLHDGKQAGVADLPRVQEACQVVVNLLYIDFVRPLWQRFPELERRASGEPLAWPA